MSAETLAALPPAVRAFAASRGMTDADLRSNGRLTLVVDQRWRIHLQPVSHNRVALTARVGHLPRAGERGGDETLLKLMKAGAGLLRDHASTLCSDEAGDALFLQQTLPGDADLSAVQDAIAEFSNVCAFWSQLCAKEAGAH